jgi:hypothetical protein
MATLDVILDAPPQEQVLVLKKGSWKTITILFTVRACCDYVTCWLGCSEHLGSGPSGARFDFGQDLAAFSLADVFPLLNELFPLLSYR